MSDPKDTIPYGYCHCGCGQKTKNATRTNPQRGNVIGMPTQYCHGHTKKPTPEQTVARFFAKVNKDGPIPEYAPHLGKCWIWESSLTRQGYGKFQIGKTAKKISHRYSYEIAHGEIPKGMVLDHLCRVRKCVNPAHLEAVTSKENTRRGLAPSIVSHFQPNCKNGHSKADHGTTHKSGMFVCKECQRLEYHARRRGISGPSIGSIRECKHCGTHFVFDHSRRVYCRDCGAKRRNMG